MLQTVRAEKADKKNGSFVQFSCFLPELWSLNFPKKCIFCNFVLTFFVSIFCAAIFCFAFAAVVYFRQIDRRHRRFTIKPFRNIHKKNTCVEVSFK